MNDVKHISVLPREVLNWLDPQPGQVVVDATVGVGEHSALLWERLHSTLTPGPSPGGRGESMLIGLDQDAAMLELAKARLPDPRVVWRHANFEDLPGVLDELKI